MKTNGPRTWDYTKSDALNPADGKHDEASLEGSEEMTKLISATANMAKIDQDTESSVLFVSNLREFITCDQLFNLFSCYGNVDRVKKFNSKPVRRYFSQSVFHINL